MLNPVTYIAALTRAGWSYAYSFRTKPDTQKLEALVHEIAHCYVLGRFTPTSNDEIGALIAGSGPKDRRDRDEILTTAITIQCMETFFGIKNETDESVASCMRNITDRYRTWNEEIFASIVADMNTPLVDKMAQKIFDHANDCVANRLTPEREKVTFYEDEAQALPVFDYSNLLPDPHTVNILKDQGYDV